MVYSTKKIHFVRKKNLYFTKKILTHRLPVIVKFLFGNKLHKFFIYLYLICSSSDKNLNP